MARPPNEDRDSVRDASITIRLTPTKKEALERLADEQRVEAQRLLGSGVQFSVGHMLIKWIDDALAAHAAKHAASTAALPGTTTLADSRQAALFPVPAPSPARVAKKAASPAPKADDEQAKVRKRLHAALDAKLFKGQRDVATATGWQQSAVSYFYNGKDCPEGKLKNMADALTKRGA